MIFTIVLMALLLGEGLYSIVAGKPFGNDRGAAKYTKESYTKMCRISGVMCILVTIGLFIFHIKDFFESAPDFVKWIGLAFMILSCAACVVAYILIPKKKTDSANSGSANNSKSNDDSDDQYVDMD